jgi:hypothetical protein
MAIQIRDTVWYNGTIYSLLQVRGEHLFDPQDYGLSPSCHTPAAERGYWCDYGINEDQFFLETLNIHTKGDVYPLLNGRKAEIGAYEDHRQYRNIALPVAFTGQMILGRDPDRSCFDPEKGLLPWGYRTVTELTFTEGKRSGSEDRSRIAAEIRAAAHTKDQLSVLQSEDVWWLDDTKKQ